MTTGNSGWSQYWQQDGADGEVFVSASGERHPALAEHWRGVLDDIAAGARLLDIASGAGSIYASLPEKHGLHLYAADIAAEALEVLSSRIANVSTVVSAADSLPFADRSFDVVVSQFGIEYAGVAAFGEAARVVAGGGCLEVLAHVRDGYIDSNNKAQLAEAELTRDSGFIRDAIQLTRSAFGSDASQLAALEQAFVPHIKDLGSAVKRCQVGVHGYLLGGFRQLYEKRAQYDVEDIVRWLQGMSGEVDKAIERLSIMRAAALGEADMRNIRATLDAVGFDNIETRLYQVEGKDLPVAWHISARRSN